jgi:hypothetical protein
MIGCRGLSEIEKGSNKSSLGMIVILLRCW